MDNFYDGQGPGSGSATSAVSANNASNSGHKGGRPVSKGGKENSKEKEKEKEKDKDSRDSKGSSQNSNSNSSQVKRKRDDDDEEEDDEDTHKGAKGTSGVTRKDPKKFKRAFGFFVKAKRADAEASIGDPTVRYASCCGVLTTFYFCSLSFACLPIRSHAPPLPSFIPSVSYLCPHNRK